MKKFFKGLLLSIILMGRGNAISTNKVEKVKANSALGFAEYVSTEYAPVIDGVIDAVWDIENSLIQTEISEEGTWGTISVLWNESGLYFLANVEDATLNKSDLSNFWVSETYCDKKEEKTYPNVDGAYYLCLNYRAENAFYNPDFWTEEHVDMTDKYVASAKETEEGYVLEIYVPLYGSSNLECGGNIGFDVSIDDYLSEGTSIADRQSYVYWNGGGQYWNYPSHLGQIMLVDLDVSNGSPMNEYGNENSVGNNGTQNNKEEQGIDKKNQSVGCGAKINFSIMYIFSFLIVMVLIKKRREINIK